MNPTRMVSEQFISPRCVDDAVMREGIVAVAPEAIAIFPPPPTPRSSSNNVFRQ